LYDDKRRTIELGDDIAFTRNDDPAQIVTKRVVALYRYPSFKDLMTDFPAVLFGWTKAEEAIEEINAFYSADDQTKYGVVGIRLA
jgi:ASC-1-like (ASCH) protein